MRKSKEELIKTIRMSFADADLNAFDNHRKLVEPMFQVSRIDETMPFYADTVAHCLADFYLSYTTSAGMRFDRTLKEITQSGMDGILVLSYLEHGFSFEIQGRNFTARAGQVVVFDLSQPFVIKADAVNNVALNISRHRFEELMPSIKNVHGQILRDGPSINLLLDHLSTLRSVASNIYASDSKAISDATMSLVAACLLPLIRRDSGRIRNVGSISLPKIKSAIEEQISQSDLGSQSLMRQFGLSRSTLYRLFTPLGGVNAYILERRLQRAFSMISDPSCSKCRISKIANELGFNNLSTFTRAFQKMFGVTPSEVRSKMSYASEHISLPWPHRQ